MTLTMVHLLSPGDPTLPTGGYRYNARVVEGLRQLGEEVTVHVVDAAWPDPEEPVRVELPEGEAVIVDELLLCGVDLRCGPTVALLHSPLFREQPPWERDAWRTREQEVLARMDAVVATSPLTIEDLGVGAELIPPGVAPSPAATPRRPSRDRPLELLSVASLIPRKGHDVLLEALRQVHGSPRCPPWRLCVVGPTPDPFWASHLLEAAEGLPVHFVGPVADPSPYYQHSDLLVHTALYESWGMVIDEALAHGLPVLSTPAGALSRAGGGAIEVSLADPPEVARALARWMLQGSVRQGLREGAAAFDAPGWDSVAEQWKALLDELVSS